MATVIEPNAFRVSAQRAELLRLRSKFLKKDRILGPAWLILIKLISRTKLTRSMEVCDLVAIPDVPATTAQRCLDYLLARGLIHLGSGPGRRFRSVNLAPQTVIELQALFAFVEDPNELEIEVIALFG